MFSSVVTQSYTYLIVVTFAQASYDIDTNKSYIGDKNASNGL